MHPSQGGPDTRTSDGAPGRPLHVKQEPGMLGHIKQEPGTPHSFHGDSFYEHSLTPFPSKPINFNFMADIEDIVQPINSGKLSNPPFLGAWVAIIINIVISYFSAEISINRLKCELAGYEGPYGCYGLSMADTKELEMMHMKREEEPIWEPPLWRQQYDNIRNMRSKRDAPVDKYGCFMNAEREVGPKVSQESASSGYYHQLLSMKANVIARAWPHLRRVKLILALVYFTMANKATNMLGFKACY